MSDCLYIAFHSCTKSKNSHDLYSIDTLNLNGQYPEHHNILKTCNITLYSSLILTVSFYYASRLQKRDLTLFKNR